MDTPDEKTAKAGPRLTIRLTEELEEWLGREADKRALDKASFVRMVLAERMNGLTPVAAPDPPKPQGPRPEDFFGIPPPERVARQPFVYRDPDPVPEMMIPADPDNEVPRIDMNDIMAEVSRVVDGIEARDQGMVPPAAVHPAMPEAFISPPPRRELPRLAPPRTASGPLGTYDQMHRQRLAGTVTMPVGVNPNVGFGNQQGDALGNIVRHNYRHLGFKPGQM